MRLSEYIDGYLTPEERHMVDSHLETCPKCSQELSALKDYLTLMHSLGRVKAPPSFAEDLAGRIKKPSLFTRLAWRFAKPFPVRIPLGAAGALAVLLVLIFSYVEFFTHRPSAPEPDAPAIHRDQADFSSPQPYKKEKVQEREIVASPDPFVSSVDGKDEVRVTETGETSMRVVLRLRPEHGLQLGERETGASVAPKASLARKGIFEEIERIVKTLDGKIVAEEPGKEGVCFPSLTVRLEHHNYPSFLNQLKRFGTLEVSTVEQPVLKDLPLEITLSVCREGNEKKAAE